jgi:transposase
MVKPRKLSREFKLSALSRMEAGEDVSALSRELKVRRKLLYEWRDAFRAGGPDALRGPGRPYKGSVMVGAKSAVGSCDELIAAKQRIGELERKVGQQALEADFFRQALRLLETSRRPSDRPGETASMPSSRLGRSGKAD